MKKTILILSLFLGLSTSSIAEEVTYETKVNDNTITLYPDQGWCLPNQRKGTIFIPSRKENKLVRFCYVVSITTSSILGLDEEGDPLVFPVSVFKKSPGT